MSSLAHPNWRELTQFVRDLNEELMTPGGTFKPEYVNINPALQEAILQFWAETTELVEAADGTAVSYGFGISGMTPKDWFNNDLVQRQRWASVIESAFNRYNEAIKAEAGQKNELAEELDKLRAELKASFEAEVASLKEAMNQQMADKMKAQQEDSAGKGGDDEEAEKKEGIDDDEESEGEA